jgi:hypothetical protein
MGNQRPRPVAKKIGRRDADVAVLIRLADRTAIPSGSAELECAGLHCGVRLGTSRIVFVRKGLAVLNTCPSRCEEQLGCGLISAARAERFNSFGVRSRQPQTHERYYHVALGR